MKIIIKNIVHLFFLFLFTTINSQVKLPKLISDGMILQRNTEIKIWGWAAANEKIEIYFVGKKYTTKANKNGEWHILTSELKAGGPHEMKILAKNKITINNILIGDVWLASGQSNMSYELRSSKKLYQNDIANSTNQNIRHFKVPLSYSFKEAKHRIKGGTWVSANPKTVGNFSAVAYFFARKIYAQEKIPIGIINSSWGGTPAQAWTSEKAIKKFPYYYKEAQLLKKGSALKNIELKNKNNQKKWIAEAIAKDQGITGNWKSKNSNDSDWKTIKLPNFWNSTIGNKKGAVWFRKTIVLENSPSSKTVVLNLGRISDADSVFVNGVFAGKTDHKFKIRNYNFSKNLLKKGKNTIAIRVLAYRGNGGFIKGNPMNLVVDGNKIPLNTTWKLKLGIQLKPLARPEQLNRKPTGLYNAMISPLLNYKIKGAIWYQGEGNASKAKEYNTLFPAMIQGWRADFKQGDFPFLFVQLANFQKPIKNPLPSNWAMLREAQTNTLKLSKTGMAVIIDVGEQNDIHPKNKKDVGFRLASEANRLIYASKKVSKSPYYKSMKIVNNGIEVSFSPSQYNLIKKGKLPLKHFAIAGVDKKFVWAEAVIKDDKIYVWSPKVKKPVTVRYAWANNPENVNLYDSKGFPISPFRTDTWKK